MIMVGAMLAAIWGIGAVMRAPRAARWNMSLLLIVLVMILQIALPDGHALREATGGDPRLWGLILGFGGLVWLYSRGLSHLRGRAVPPPDDTRFKATPEQMSVTELERYARHIVLREIGGAGQMSLRKARVLIVGAGGLGSPALQYLAAAGIGTIGVIDDDEVENANLQRQVIHTDDRIGLSKVQSAAEAIGAQNPFVTVNPYNRRLTEDIASELIADYDLVLDGSDNFTTRYLVNEACVQRKVPLVAAALTQWEGQISVYDPARGTPCYACVFPSPPDPGLVPSCAEAGVLGPLPGVVGAMMAVEAIKLITAAGEPLTGRLLIYDALYAESRIMQVARRNDCEVCGGS